ncbi:DUF6578 domain-containing protein [Microbacterium sp. RURRCA19A]|uniref:DUF6578 domain-containing protein n=1 Tax=Microbacterium sp. RURRCA19A TaxID=1907391 RepID=UPI000956C36E|nr:DUF6578 domain-containing protein [Microbacterium sp. RURRCA19A]SIR58385.1 hypothetical protein SAMN05880568_0549 [Microbacterium sp. RURRCA19A]
MDPLTARSSDVTRVWLETWEWECCGEPFGIGDEVDLLLLTRTPSAAFVESVGLELAATVDAIESHHQETPSTPEDRVRGRVRGIHAVVQEHLATRHLRRPGFGAPPDAEMPAEGEDWPFQGRDLGNGFMIGSRPTKWMIESVPVPGAVTLVPRDRVPSRSSNANAASVEESEPPLERRTTSVVAWVVDVASEP